MSENNKETPKQTIIEYRNQLNEQIELYSLSAISGDLEKFTFPELIGSIVEMKEQLDVVETLIEYGIQEGHLVAEEKTDFVMIRSRKILLNSVVKASESHLCDGYTVAFYPKSKDQETIILEIKRYDTESIALIGEHFGVNFGLIR